MAQSLIAFYCFNDNDTATVHDFSGNAHHSTSVASLAITTDSGAVGKVASAVDATAIDFGNVTALNGLTGFSCVFKINVSALHAGISTSYITKKNSEFDIFIDDPGYLNIYIFDSLGNPYHLTASAIFTLGTWQTIVITWDGENLKYFNGSSTVVDSLGAAFTTMYTDTDDFYVFDGVAMTAKMEMISFYNKALSVDEIDTIMENPSGLAYEAGDGMVQTGDLVYNNSGGKEICTWYETLEEIEFEGGGIIYFEGGGIITF